MNKSTNWSLRIALMLPVAMIVIVAASIYIPARFQTYRGQFVYSVPAPGVYGSMVTYRVAQGKLEENVPLISSSTTHPPIPYPNLYVHDLETNTSRDISLAEAKTLTLDSTARSWDGLEIVCGKRSVGFIPFEFDGMTDCTSVYAQGAHSSMKLNVHAQPTPYYAQFQFLGWVKS